MPRDSLNCSPMSLAIDRRSFFTRAVALAALGRFHVPGPTLRVAVVTSSANTDRYRGALLGVEEAEHAAKLFGGSAVLERLAKPDDPAKNVAAFIGGDTLDSARTLADRAAREHALFINLDCSSDELRGARCSATMFHVAPSDAMLRDARARVRGAAPIIAWDSTLVRFGADTLNDRFRARFGAPMTPSAWTAWFAVKVLWESSLRMKSADPRQLLDYLTRDTTQFDGHKGRPLSFRSWDHQLRQFVYTRVDGKPVDIPQSARPDATSHEVLDQLGTSASVSTCHR
jgi:ABC-type branched-subunit amino acid transport system substrate-binding protein